MGFKERKGSPVKALAIDTSITNLVYSFTHLAPASNGALQAKVTVDGTWTWTAEL